MSSVGSTGTQDYSRISGLATGLDTEGMVKQLINAESYRLNKYKQNQQAAQWKQEIYRNTNLDLGNFIVNTKKELELSSATTSGLSLSRSIESVSWLKEAFSSNTSTATVTARGTAVPGSYSLQVNQLAKGVYGASKSNITTDGTTKVSLSTQLKDIQGIGLAVGDIDQFYINGKEIKKSDGSSLTDTSTVQDLINAVNSSGAGVTMSYDSNLGRFFISSNSTGADSKLQVTNDGAAGAVTGNTLNLMNALNLSVTYGDGSSEDFSAVNSASGTYLGQDASYDFAGAVGLTSSTNQVTVNGVTMTFAGEGSSTITVNTNVDQIVAKVKKFFEEDYNQLLDQLNTKTTEKVYRDFQPLTDAQKESMTEEQIKKWEEKAKSGLLKNDSSINNMILQLRGAIYEEVEEVDSQYNTLYKIGIDTKSYFEGGKDGQVKIDETKLRKALTANPQAVLDILFKNSSGDYTSRTQDSSTKETTKKNMGIIGRIYNEMTIGIKNIVDKAGYGTEGNVLRNVKGNIFIDFVTGSSAISLLDKDLTSINKQITKEQDILARKEEMYYKKFSALETAMSQMNSQAGWFAQQFGG